MAIAFVDTNVLFASVSARDEFHESARSIVRGIDHGRLPEASITNYVVAETMNLVRERLDPDLATDLLDSLREGAHFEISHAARSDFHAGEGLFRRHPRLSFVDAVTIAQMEREGVEFLYSFDDGFDAIDSLTRLESAVDPY